MGMIELPFFARCTISGAVYDQLPVVSMNMYTAKVRLPNGDVVKRSFRKHDIDLTYVSPSMDNEGGSSNVIRGA